MAWEIAQGILIAVVVYYVGKLAVFSILESRDFRDAGRRIKRNTLFSEHKTGLKKRAKREERMTIKQARELIGKTVEVESMHGERVVLKFSEQEKPYSQSFWCFVIGQRRLIDVTTLTLIRVIELREYHHLPAGIS